jgi:hypothetical protein
MGAGVRRGPGLIGTAARTAVVAGTATAVSGNVSRRQQAKAASQQQAAADEQAQRDAQAQAQAQQMQMSSGDSASAGAGGISDAALAKLEQLAELRKQGILTDEEFAAQKAKILA